MARRGRKPKRHVDWGSHRSTAASAVSLLSLLIGVVAILSIFAGVSNTQGELNSTLHDILIGYFGYLALFIPIIAIYFGLLFIGTLKWKFLSYQILAGLVLLFVGLLGIFGDVGGQMGSFLQDIVARYISVPGAIFFYLALIIFSIVLTTGKGIDWFAEHLGKSLNYIKEKIFRIDITKSDGKEVDAELMAKEMTMALESGKADASDMTDRPYDINGNDDDKNDNDSNVVDSTLSDDDDDEIMDSGYNINVPSGQSTQESKEKNFEIISPPSGPVEDEKDLLSGKLSEVEVNAETLEEVSKPIETSEPKSENPKPEKEATDPISKMPFSNKLWEYPSIDLFSDAPNQAADAGDVNERAKVIEDTLKAFGVKADIAKVNVGPAFTRYDLNLSIGTKANKIQNLSTDLALRIKSPSGSVRIVAPVPGTNLVGIEVPNFTPSTVPIRNVLASNAMKKTKDKLSIAMGHDVSGNPVIENIAKWPHALVAGATGAGKSAMLNALISTILYRCSPQECRFIMIDPKMVEMTGYNGIPHLLTPVVTDVEQKAVSALAWAVSEMERRYKVFSEAGVRNIDSYNTMSGFRAEPYILIVIDELADMMMVASADVEKYITRLAQKSRAVGIHLVIATQRPSVNVLTGTIKANIPTRIAFKVTSNTDSRVIIDQAGAETLIGRGDMLYVPPNDSKPTRIQGVWISDEEIKALVEYLKNTGFDPDYKDEITEHKVESAGSKAGSASIGNDDKIGEALEIIINENKASASYLQRKLGVGYSRAARMIDDFEDSGIIGPARGSKPRDVLVVGIDEAMARLGGADSDTSEENNGDF